MRTYKRIDLTGKRFGKLVVVKELPHRSNKVYTKVQRLWQCKCDCGNLKSILQTGLVRKNLASQSCGCIKKIKGFKVPSVINYRRLYNIWHKMMLRCSDHKQKSYKNYGGRGIKVSKQWTNFSIFYTDNYLSYIPGLTIERLDVNGNYCKKNCIWIPNKDQAKNRRTTRWINGMCAKDACKTIGLKYSTFKQRLKSGKTTKQAFH